MKLAEEDLLSRILPTNAGAHNSVCRGKDITDIYYDGTVSQEIAEGNFKSVFVGDYIIGKNSGRTFIVAEIDPFYGMGDTECTIHHILMIPKLAIGDTQQMNSSASTTGGYVSSAMRTANMDSAKTIIKNDFENILTYRDYLITTITNGYPSAGGWNDCDIELMNESMVYGSKLRSPSPAYNGSSITTVLNTTISISQLSIFRLRPDLIVAKTDNGIRTDWWLRDIASTTQFVDITAEGRPGIYSALTANGVRPAFPIF